jgi:hypothetical protein
LEFWIGKLGNRVRPVRVIQHYSGEAKEISQFPIFKISQFI